LKRRGFATFMVLWAVVLVAIVLGAIQVYALRQSVDARRQVARVRALWAARAGVEAQVAALTAATLSPDAQSPLTVQSDLEAAASGELQLARYDIQHEVPTGRLPGPADAHAKININTATREDLLLLPDMDESIADAILDWIDSDDDTREFGAESGQYLGMRYPYLPRNAPFRSIQELELVVGVRPEFVRGEDWNLNGVLDPNEDDGDASWPPDNADGKLDAGWSGWLTAESESGPGWALSGQPRLDLTSANETDLQNRLGVDASQAQAILQAVQVNSQLTLKDFIGTSLGDLAVGATGGASATLLSGQSAVPDLTRDQLKALLDEAWIGDPGAPDDPAKVNTGKININTIDEDTLQYVSRLSTAQIDALIVERQSRQGGFASLTDLLDVPSISQQTLAELYDVFDVRSNTFVVSSRGIDTGTGLQVEVVATISRVRLPVEIRRLTVR
jgi:DNA uptake protein ComE-like DNA-binding protein